MKKYFSNFINEFMFSIAWRTIKDRKVSLIIYCLAGLLFLWMYIGLFPTFADKAGEFDKLLEVYPPELMEAFGISEETQIFGSIENFLATEQYSFVWPIMVIALAVAIAGSSISGEIEAGTIETLLAQPISRVKIFFGKYFAGVFNLAVFSIVSTLGAIPLIAAYNIDYQTKGYFMILLLGFLFGLAVMSITFLFSVIFSSKGKAYFVPVGVLILMYVLKIVASLKESLEDLKYFSFFHYFDSFKAISQSQIDNLAYWVFGGVVIVFTITAVIWFSKRDIAIS